MPNEQEGAKTGANSIFAICRRGYRVIFIPIIVAYCSEIAKMFVDYYRNPDESIFRLFRNHVDFSRNNEYNIVELL